MIRILPIDNAPLLAALHSESFGAARWSLAQIKASLALDSTRVWMACEGDAAQGFILLQVAADEVEILTFCVVPDARRTGIGRQLLNTAIATARQEKARRLFLEVAADNVAAIKLYEQAGFKSIGTRPGYYPRKDAAVDALMLALDL